MAANKRTPCYCATIMAVVIIVLTVLILRGVLQPLWPAMVIIVLAGLMGISAITGCCCANLGKGKEGTGSCCQPHHQGE